MSSKPQVEHVEIIEGEVEETTELIVTGGSQFLPVMSIETAIERRKALVEFTKEIMVRDKDFGVIEGTSKPSLLKAGAEKLTTFFGLTPVMDDLEAVADWTGADHGGEAFFYYRYKCQLYRGSLLIGEGIGSCNSWESKYRYRNANLVCPTCGEEAVIKGKEQFGGGWLCWAKKGGCGAKWEDGAQVIEGQERGKVLNENPADLNNTIDKMAQKRALVAATLIGVNASEFFTQDMEDVNLGNTTAVQMKPNTSQAKPPQSNGNSLRILTSSDYYTYVYGTLGIAKTDAELIASVLSECGGDFTKAADVLKEQYTGPKV